MKAENQTKIRVLEGSNLCPETLTKNAVQDFHLWKHYEDIVLAYFQTKYSFEMCHVFMKKVWTYFCKMFPGLPFYLHWWSKKEMPTITLQTLTVRFLFTLK